MRWLSLCAVALLIAVVGGGFSMALGAPEDELPDGEGKRILLAACTSCHDLGEVTKLRGFYDRAQWRDVSVTMMEYGADVDVKQIEVLADYLALHLGRK